MARCASCTTINRGLNTPGRRCEQCDSPMVFNANTDGFSDTGFARAMARVSANGQHAYTESQLYYAVSGSRPSKGKLISRIRRRSPQPPTYLVPTIAPARFQENLAKWLAADAPITGRLLMRPDISGEPNRARSDDTALHSELTAYGFDRVVVVENAPTAVMLVANNFHIDHRCAILSDDGYPEAFHPQLLEILNRNPSLVVAAVHGISVGGLRMTDKLRRWFPHPQIRIIDVGLRPGQGVIGKLPATRDRRKQPDEALMADPALARLDPWEREWLAWGLTVRLDTLTPQQLMDAIGQAFNKMAQLDDEELQTALRLQPTTERRATGNDGADLGSNNLAMTGATHHIVTGDVTTAAPIDAGDGSAIEHEYDDQVSGRGSHEPTGGLFWWDHYHSGESPPDGLDPTSLSDHDADSASLGGLGIGGATFDGGDFDGDG